MVHRASYPEDQCSRSPGEAFSSFRPDLDDEILDFKLSLNGMKLGNLEGRHECIFHVWVFELLNPKGRLW